MSRKHYREAADVIRGRVETARANGNTATVNALLGVAGDLATMFKADNSRFDREKFMEACGL